MKYKEKFKAIESIKANVKEKALIQKLKQTQVQKTKLNYTKQN